MENQDSHTWVDRTEYERLKNLELTMLNRTVVLAKPETDINQSDQAMPMNGIFSKADKSMTKRQQFFSILPVVLLATSALLAYEQPIFMIPFLVLGIIGLVRSIFDKRLEKGLKATIVLSGFLLLFSAAPMIMLIFFYVSWQLGCWTGLGSCETA